MRNESGDIALLYDMLDSASAIRDLIKGIEYKDYLDDRRTRRAIEREIEIIQE